MSLPETTVASGAAAETSGRWGDYYQMTVDPVDDCPFWFVGMYRPSGSWQTRIADFKFPACTGGTTTYSLAGNWNRTEVDRFNPDFVDEARVYKLEESLPRTKGYFSVNHQRQVRKRGNMVGISFPVAL